MYLISLWYLILPVQTIARRAVYKPTGASFDVCEYFTHHKAKTYQSEACDGYDRRPKHYT